LYVTVAIRRILKDYDMRKVHALRRHWAIRALRSREVIAAVNSSLTICRLVTREGEIISRYADDDEYFDVEALDALALGSIGIRLRVAEGTLRGGSSSGYSRRRKEGRA
jgi:hypothetical protein